MFSMGSGFWLRYYTSVRSEGISRFGAFNFVRFDSGVATRLLAQEDLHVGYLEPATLQILNESTSPLLPGEEVLESILRKHLRNLRKHS